MLRAIAAIVLVGLTATSAAAQTVPLTVHVAGSAPGTAAVIGGAGGLCATPASTQCVFQVPTGTVVRVVANAPGGQQPGRLSNGSGPAAACALSTCGFTMTAAAEVTVTFTAGDGPVATLTTTTDGDGSGSVAADNSRCQNIDAAQPSACATVYLQGSAVAVTAAPAAGSRFSGYSGTAGAAACGAGAQCSFTLGTDATLTATFHKLVALRVQPGSQTRVIGQTATFTASGQYSNGVTETIAQGPGTWVNTVRLGSARYAFAVAAVSQFPVVVYALGGVVSGTPSALVEANSGSGWVGKAAMTTPREGLAAATFSGTLYAIGGNTTGGNPVAAVERYTASSDSWAPVAPLAKPRRYLAAATVNDFMYAVGGETVVSGTATVVGDVETYVGNLWIPRAPMPTPRRSLGVGSVNGILYAIGGQTADGNPAATVEAYDPATDTWTAKTPMPAPRSGAAVASIGMLLYVIGGTGPGGMVAASTYVYDAADDTWTTRADMATPRTGLAASNLTGPSLLSGSSLLAIGGRAASGAALDTVENFHDSLVWFSSQPKSATVSQSGIATARAFGRTTIFAGAGSIGCTIFPVSSCGSVDAQTVPTDMSLDVPSNNSTVSQPFEVLGWAINRSATNGTGVDAIHVYAVPTGGGSAIFLGVGQYGLARSDIGALYGSQFTNSGFTLAAVNGLPVGSYSITAYARNTASGSFDTVRAAAVTVVTPVSKGFLAVDYPSAGSVVTSAFEVTGWAIDQGAGIGTGVDGVQFYIQPAGAPAPGVFVGTGSYGIARSDVGGIFGARFTNSGYHFTITGLGPLTGNLNVYAHSTVTGAYSIVKAVPITVNSSQLMSIDLPSPESTITAPTFKVAGWAIDRATPAAAGTGVDALHIYAFPNPGSGQAPIFLGVATIGIARSDVAGIYGARYTSSGYELTVSRAAAGLAPGPYNIVVVAHSTSGTFNNQAAVRVTLQ